MATTTTNTTVLEIDGIAPRQVDLFTREMRIKCARVIHEQSCQKSRAASGKDTR